MRLELLTKNKVKSLLEVSDVKKPIYFISGFILRYWKVYALLVLLLVSDIGITLFFTWFLQNMTDAVVARNTVQVGRYLIAGIILVFISVTVVFLNTYFESIAVNKVKRDVKNSIYKHMMRLPSSYYLAHHSGELVSHLTNDIEAMDGAIGGNLIRMLRLPLMAAGAFIYLLYVNWKLSLLCLILGPFAVLSGAIFGKLIRKKSKLIQAYLAGLVSFLNDSFAGHWVIRSFTLEQILSKKYEQKNEQLLATQLQLAKWRGIFRAGADAAGTITFIVSIGLGGYLVMKGSMTIGSLLAFINLMHYLVYPMTGLAGLWGAFQKSLAAISRLQQVLEQKTEARSSLPFPIHRKLDSSITFQNVSFYYEENQHVIQNFNLEISQGNVIALVGPSGAGKSTIFQLIQGFFQPISGDIFFGHRNMKELSLSEIRNAIAYVPQDGYLFAGTIKENISCAKVDASNQEIVEAAKNANAHNFIMNLPYGYDTEIGERGTKLSGGQRQRIAIARAILKDAPILLLDEATSALDGEAESIVQEALDRLMKHRTTLVISHRLSTIKHADLIVVLDQGQLIEDGTHLELIANNGFYSRMYRLQTEKSEWKLLNAKA